MTPEDQIAALVAQAEPLRALPDDEAEAKGLPALVEQINALRAQQAVVPSIYGVLGDPVNGEPVPESVTFHAEPQKRGPGRPRKAA